MEAKRMKKVLIKLVVGMGIGFILTLGWIFFMMKLVARNDEIGEIFLTVWKMLWSRPEQM